MATTTITTNGQQDARISEAFGNRLGLGRNATQAEVKAALVAYLVGVVRDYETRQAIAAATATVAEITPS